MSMVTTGTIIRSSCERSTQSRRVVLVLAALVALALVAPLPAVAAGDVNMASCPNEALEGFREQLPDCRAYEQVTPTQGSRVEVKALSADGSHAIVQSFGDFGPGDAQNDQSEEGATYELSRGSSGWAAEGIEPPASQFPWDGYLDATPDLSETLFYARRASESVYDLDLMVREADGAIRDVGPMLPPSLTEGPPSLGLPRVGSVTGLGGSTDGVAYVGASSDFSRVLFTITVSDVAGETDVRWPGDTTETTDSATDVPSLYEYTEGQSGSPALVGVNDERNLIGECGVTLGPGIPSEGVNPHSSAVSQDGSVVFFTVLGTDFGLGTCSKKAPPVDELFARVDEDRTVAISEPSPSECGEGAGTAEVQCRNAPLADAWFAGASRDGSKVFFTSTQQLTDEASEDSTPGDSAVVNKAEKGCGKTTGVGGCNLYEYELNAGDPAEDRLVTVSGGTPDPQVQGVVSVSEDGSHVYFVAKSVLTGSETNEYGHAAQAGANNLYVFQQDGAYPAGHLAFITTLSSETTSELEAKKIAACGTLSGTEKVECEEPLQREFEEKNRLDEGDWEVQGFSEAGIAATATPDGRFLVFPSVADLTPDDTSTVQQIFRYDAQSGELVRVSVGEDGFNQDGNTSTMPAEIPQYNRGPLAPQGLAVSKDGTFVVFRSADGLTQGALNAQPLENGAAGFAENVYEYHDGSVFLLSDGQDASAYQREGSSVTVGTHGTVGEGIVGSGDVFFQTADPLVARDGDTQRSLYDARIDGGFPVEAPAGCAAEGCQGAPSAPSLTFGAPASMSLTGAGNLAPAPTVTVIPRKIVRCTKPKKLSHGKCVKTRAKAKAGKARAKSSHGRGK